MSAQPAVEISLAKAKESADAAVNWSERAFADRAAEKVAYAYQRAIRGGGYAIAAAPVVERTQAPAKVLALFTEQMDRSLDAIQRVHRLALEVGLTEEKLADLAAEEERRARGP